MWDKLKKIASTDTTTYRSSIPNDGAACVCVHVGPRKPVSDEGLGQTGDRADLTEKYEHLSTETEIGLGVHPQESATSVYHTRFLTESWGSLMD